MVKEKIKLSYKRFNAARIFALIAFFCTLLLAVIILAEALTPSSGSAAQSGNIANGIKDIANINDNDAYIPTQSIVLRPSTGNFIGDVVKPTVIYLPSGASDKDVIFESSDESVAAVTEDGRIRFVGTGVANVVCRLKSDTSILSKAYYICFGPPADSITELKLSSVPAFKEGSVTSLNLCDQNGTKVSLAALGVTIEDPQVLAYFNLRFTGLKGGKTDITFTTRNAVSLTITADVLDDPDFIAPERFVYDEVIEATVGNVYSVADYVHGVLPAGSTLNATTYTRSFKNPEGKAILQANQDEHRTFAVCEAGEAEIHITSTFNSDCVGVIKVIAVEPVPTELSMVGKNRVCVDDTNSVRAFYKNAYLYDVTWSVVEGDAELFGDGVYRAKKLGTLVLRATSNSNPDVYADIEITVSLFENFAYFVRKVIGHFGLFMLLGIGLGVSLFMLIKPRWLFAILSPVLGFLTALLSEVFQKPIFTSGRTASWTDVMIDTTGAVAGILIAAIGILIVTLIIKASKNYRSTKASVGFLTFKTAFKPYVDLHMFYKIKARSPRPRALPDDIDD